jgi:hypothetical protein
LGDEKQKRIPFLKNKAEKLLKKSTCGKNKAKNKPGHIVEKKRRQKSGPAAKTAVPWPQARQPSPRL